MLACHLDFEVFSYVDLKKAGLHKYARHDGTDVMCLAWKIGMRGLERLWLPGMDMPAELRKHVAAGAPLKAFNAGFEREIWACIMVPYYGWPAVPDGQWHCTAVRAARVNLNRSLDKAADSMDLAQQKDKDGHKNMMWLCSPKRRRRRFEPEKLQKMYDYCKQDVRTEACLEDATPPVPPEIERVWRMDQRINRRGVPVDLDLCRGAVELLRQQTVVVNHRLQELSDGRVEGVTKRSLLAELQRYHPDLPNLDRKKTLDPWFREDKFTDPVALEIATIRKNDGLASVKKAAAVLKWADPDSRCRNTLKFLGAGPGRWSCQGPQFQNMMRAKPPSEEAIAAITGGDMQAALKHAKDGDITGLIGAATRSIICAPPGRTLIQSDFSAIEARLVAWIAGDEDQLGRFLRNEDVYIQLAAKIYGKRPEEIDKDSLERKVGKEAELSLGYRSGALSFQTKMWENWGVRLDLDFCETVKDTYRYTHPQITQFWRDTENCALMAIRREKPVAMGRPGGPSLVFDIEKHGAHKWLTIRLPSGRKLYYYKPHIAPSKFDKPSFWYWGPIKGSKWGDKNAHGGVLTQNVCEGMGFDLISSAMLRIEDHYVYTVLTIHDSVFSECSVDDKETPALVHRLMQVVPDWAAGLPVKTETTVARRMQ